MCRRCLRSARSGSDRAACDAHAATPASIGLWRAPALQAIRESSPIHSAGPPRCRPGRGTPHGTPAPNDAVSWIGHRRVRRYRTGGRNRAARRCQTVRMRGHRPTRGATSPARRQDAQDCDPPPARNARQMARSRRSPPPAGHAVARCVRIDQHPAANPAGAGPSDPSSGRPGSKRDASNSEYRI